jgi:hypothetical protein
VGAVSSNTALLPPTGITVSGTGGSRLLRLAPAAGLSGSTTITVTVSDGSLSSSRSFQVTVDAHPTPRTPPPPADVPTSNNGSSNRCGSGSLNMAGLILLLGTLLRSRTGTTRRLH